MTYVQMLTIFYPFVEYVIEGGETTGVATTKTEKINEPKAKVII